MTALGLVVVLGAALLEAGFMLWTRLFGFHPGSERSVSVRMLQRVFSRLKYVGGLVGIAVLVAVLVGTPLQHVGVNLSDSTSVGTTAVVFGVGIGVALYMLTELLIPVVNALGFSYDPGYEQIVTTTPGGWPVFLGVELPAISLREELIFRVALIGVASSLLGVSPWVMAAVSTAVFGIIHFTGDGGVVIATILGGCLAAVFVLTNSLLAIVVAHTIVNGTEFIVHYALDVNLGERLSSNSG